MKTTAFLLCALAPAALAATFTGTNGDWFDSANWSPAGPPDSATDASIAPGTRALIDPALGPSAPTVRDLALAPGSSLTTLPGTEFSFRKITLDGATLIARSSEFSGDEIEIPATAAASTIWFNPSTNDTRTIKINANNPAKHTLGFGLAGTTPASAANTGAGHYARINVEDAILGDRLAIQLFQGFTPAPGDSFLIINATDTLTGTFDGLPEGAIVARYGSTDLVISYQGGDGNDVVLTAIASGKNRFTGRDTDWFDALNWSQRRLPSANHDLLLENATVVLDPPRPGLTIALADVVLREDSTLTLRNARVTADTVDVENAFLELESSHLSCVVFIDPFSSGFKLNPSFLECDEFRLTKLEGVAAFGIDGTTPAGPGALGSGHHARVQTGSAFLDGTLEIYFPHGFLAAPGQSYEIITVTQPNTPSTGLHGTFIGAPEGALVGRQRDVGFYISYLGGDGNDVVLTTATLPPTGRPLARFLATSGNWENPALWDTASVPDGAVDVLLTGGQEVTFEPPTPGDTLTLGDLVLRDQSGFTLRNAKLIADLVDSENSGIELIASHLTCAVFIDPVMSGFKLNPSFLECDEFRLTKLEGTIAFGIDGTTPAGPAALGSGHYSRVQTGEAWLDGNIEIFFPHGFTATSGQTYEIITITSPTGLHGSFLNAAEGALVARQGNIGFYLSYTGGDGNDVTLTTATLGATDPNPLAIFQGGTSDDFLTAANWLPAAVPVPGTDALFYDGATALIDSAAIALGELTLRRESTLTVRNSTLTATRIDVSDSLLICENSHLTCGIFIDPLTSGFKLNPSFLECDEFHLTKLEGGMEMGIDGTTPAGPGALGSGHYARVQTGSAFLDGNLEIFFPHGFTPTAGQTFEILTVTDPQSPLTGLHGRFLNVREGDPVARVGDVSLFLSYAGGDGNDVTLTARPIGRLENPRKTATGFQADLATQQGRLHHIEASDDLLIWDIIDSLPGDGSTHGLILPAVQAARGFYRAR
jgi:hypothetical protein